MTKKRLYLVDATAFCYRAFYAVGGLSTSFGQPTNAIFGFTAILQKIFKTQAPEYMAVCFDVSRDTFRQKKFAEYKIQRPPMPDGLSSQIAYIRQVISAFGLVICEKAGYEADDVIATLAVRARREGFAVTIISQDKDILQLVNSDVEVLNPAKDDAPRYTVAKVQERYGVDPERIVDIIALMGDSADNIPGIPGIGEKTAVNLLKKFGTVEKILARVDEIPQEKLRTAITEHAQRAVLNKELALLYDNVELDTRLEEFKTRLPDYPALFKLYTYLEFKSLLKSLPRIEEDKLPPPDIKGISDQSLPKIFHNVDTVILGLDEAANIILLLDSGYYRLERKNIGDNFRRLCADQQIKKIAHDLKRLQAELMPQGCILSGLYFDTMLAWYLLDPSHASYDVSDIAYKCLDVLPAQAGADIFQALELVRKLEPCLEQQLREKFLWDLFSKIEIPLTTVLADMQVTGVALDTAFLAQYSTQLQGRLVSLVERIHALCGCEFNINSPKQLGQVLFERLKLPVVKKTKTGPSTDEEVLRTLAREHELPRLLLEYRQLMKLKNTYVDALPVLIQAGTGRLHTSFNQTGTETGRLSSTNPNLQNIPIKTDAGKQIRKAFVAFDKKSVLLSCDYSQIELRILAHLSQDEILTEAFRQGRDIHKATAALIYGVTEADVSDQMRDVAKRVNFGIIYGLTSYGLSRDLGISPAQAQGFIDAYFLRYPGVRLYLDGQIKKAESDGFVVTLMGRRRYIPEINNKSLSLRQFAQRQAVNAPIQGSASDLIKYAMIEIYAELNQNKFRAKMIMQVHDELVFNVPEDELRVLAVMVKAKMEQVIKLDVPIGVDMKQGRNWSEMEPLG